MNITFLTQKSIARNTAILLVNSSVYHTNGLDVGLTRPSKCVCVCVGRTFPQTGSNVSAMMECNISAALLKLSSPVKMIFHS